MRTRNPTHFALDYKHQGRTHKTCKRSLIGATIWQKQRIFIFIASAIFLNLSRGNGGGSMQLRELSNIILAYSGGIFRVIFICVLAWWLFAAMVIGSMHLAILIMAFFN